MDGLSTGVETLELASEVTSVHFLVHTGPIERKEAIIHRRSIRIVEKVVHQSIIVLGEDGLIQRVCR